MFPHEHVEEIIQTCTFDERGRELAVFAVDEGSVKVEDDEKGLRV